MVSVCLEKLLSFFPMPFQRHPICFSSSILANPNLALASLFFKLVVSIHVLFLFIYQLLSIDRLIPCYQIELVFNTNVTLFKTLSLHFVRCQNIFDKFIFENRFHAEMVVNVPFKRWAPMLNPWPDSERRTLYRLETTDLQHIIAAVKIPTQGDQFLYEQCNGCFVRHYQNMLPLGHVFLWNSSFKLHEWLDNIIYHSFLRHSTEGVTQLTHIISFITSQY